jgi:hypothetical protein
MTDLHRVLRRIEGGARVSIAMDYYGREKIQFRSWWQPWPRTIDLGHEEIREVKRALWYRRQSRARSPARNPA